jgi:hypothetical protein
MLENQFFEFTGSGFFVKRESGGLRQIRVLG